MRELEKYNFLNEITVMRIYFSAYIGRCKSKKKKKYALVKKFRAVSINNIVIILSNQNLIRQLGYRYFIKNIIFWFQSLC